MYSYQGCAELFLAKISLSLLRAPFPPSHFSRILHFRFTTEWNENNNAKRVRNVGKGAWSREGNLYQNIFAQL